MNREQALKSTVKLWDYLAENPHIEKSKAVRDLHLTKEADVFHCPLCTYVNKKTDGDFLASAQYLIDTKPEYYCKKHCPLSEFWSAPRCVNDGTVYTKWRLVSGYEKAEYAKQIADAAREELKKNPFNKKWFFEKLEKVKNSFLDSNRCISDEESKKFWYTCGQAAFLIKYPEKRCYKYGAAIIWTDLLRETEYESVANIAEIALLSLIYLTQEDEK